MRKPIETKDLEIDPPFHVIMIEVNEIRPEKPQYKSNGTDSWNFDVKPIVDNISPSRKSYNPFTELPFILFATFNIVIILLMILNLILYISSVNNAFN